MSEQKHCANCEEPLGRETGDSSLYNPGGDEIRLCAPCFHEEDGFIEQTGTNNHPDLLKRYNLNILKNG